MYVRQNAFNDIDRQTVQAIELHNIESHRKKSATY